MAAQASGVSYRVLQDRRFQGDRQPAVPSGGKGAQNSERWTVPQVMAVATARVLDKHFGIDVKDMADIIDLLWNISEAAMLASFREGRSFVMIVGKQVCGKMLFTEDDIVNNPGIDYKAAHAIGMPLPVGLNLARLYDRVCSAMFLDDVSADVTG